MEIEEIIQLLPWLLEGRASEEQEKEVSRWLEEDEGNPVLYKELCAMYYKLHYAHRWADIDPVTAGSKIRLGMEKKSIRLRLTAWASGIAVLLEIGLCVSYFVHREDVVMSERIIAKDVKSGEKKALLTLADGRQVELKADHRVNMDLGTVTAIEDSLVGLVYQVKDSSKTPLEYHLLSVPRAGEYIMTLSDGTKVWLNSETEMKYPVAFGGGKREVFITGEAFFEVVKDSTRPFIVHTPYTHTTVLGTSFNVMAYAGEERTEITLVTGCVHVEAGTSVCRITPGYQVQVDNTSLNMKNRQVNTAFFTSWKEGVFDFDRMTLDQLCVQLSRWYDVDFFFANQSAAEKRFTGAIKRNNTLRFMLDFVEKTSNVRFEVNGKTVSVYNQ